MRLPIVLRPSAATGRGALALIRPTASFFGSGTAWACGRVLERDGRGGGEVRAAGLWTTGGVMARHVFIPAAGLASSPLRDALGGRVALGVAAYVPRELRK